MPLHNTKDFERYLRPDRSDALRVETQAVALFF